MIYVEYCKSRIAYFEMRHTICVLQKMWSNVSNIGIFVKLPYFSTMYVLDDQTIMSEIDNSGVNILNTFYDPFVV